MIPNPRHPGRRLHSTFVINPSPDSPRCSNIPLFIQRVSVRQRGASFGRPQSTLGTFSWNCIVRARSRFGISSDRNRSLKSHVWLFGGVR